MHEGTAAMGLLAKELSGMERNSLGQEADLPLPSQEC